MASNRLPVHLVRRGEGRWDVRSSAGGLVSAVRPVLEERGGRWIGWCGACDVSPSRIRELLDDAGRGFDLESVPLSPSAREHYYLGFCNRTLWPLLHGLSCFCESRTGDWTGYRDVNRAFAEVVASRGAGPIWVHDYHLMLVGQELRRSGCGRPTGYFLHTPFPEAAVMRDLRVRDDLVRALSAFDSIGFQTALDRMNFLDTVAEWRDETGGGGDAASDPVRRMEGRTRVSPVSIDPGWWARRASAPHVERRAAEIRRAAGGRRVLLGVDRLDYTKGLPQKLRGYALALERRPSLRGRVVLRQLAVPSRVEIPVYAALGRIVEDLANEVNLRFGTPDWTPVDYIRGAWETDELVAQYRAADVALVTPLRDGMNLVAKEYCASTGPDPGVLVLSRFAGAARQFGSGALLVDPSDTGEMAEGIVRAVSMPRGERMRRMAALMRILRDEDVRAWARDLLQALEGTVASGLPRGPDPLGSRRRWRRGPRGDRSPTAPPA